METLERVWKEKVDAVVRYREIGRPGVEEGDPARWTGGVC
jgi:hypothetical protein